MTGDELYVHWLTLVQPYSGESELTKSFFNEIITAYTEKNRKYHNLHHIADLLKLSVEYEKHLKDPSITRLSIFYHDLVYSATSSDNEEKSAQVAEARLNSINISADKVQTIALFIRCTKAHTPQSCSLSEDLCYFLDFDLSILGADAALYENYAQAIRKEYSIYPDLLYKPGRKKVLLHFLDKPRIFLTEEFRSRFEGQARINLRHELETL